MIFSYWEKQWLAARADITIIGAGLVGSFSALALSRTYPRASIQIVDAHAIPQGASTKNAGFICTGSASELLSNINEQGADELWTLVERRWKGRLLLQEFLDTHGISWSKAPAYEIFTESLAASHSACISQLTELNHQMHSITGLTDFFLPGGKYPDHRSESSSLWQPHVQCISQYAEGQIQPMVLLMRLHEVLREARVRVITGFRASRYEMSSEEIIVHGENDARLLTDRLVIASNGFAKNLIPTAHITAVRNQVIVSQRIPRLPAACIHMDRGYYYFRNVGSRLLAGGGRHELGNDEITSELAISNVAKTHLQDIALQTFQIPSYDVAHHWSGILGLPSGLGPSAQRVEDRIYAAVGMGGMGLSIASQLASEMADLIE